MGYGSTVMRRMIAPVAAAAVIVLAQSAALLAGDGDCFHEVDAYVRYIPGRRVEATSGKVEITESDAEYRYQPKLFGKLPVQFSLETKHISIEDTVPVPLPSHLTAVIWGVETTLPLFKVTDTYLRFGVNPSFHDEDWNFDSSSFRIPSYAYLIYKPNDVWLFLLGVAAYPDFETEAFPIAGFIYTPNDRLTVRIVPKRPGITYALTDALSVFVEGGGSFASEFEVKRENTEHAVLRYRETHLGSGVKLKINRYLQGSVSVGGVFGRRLEYRDGTGKVGIKDGMYTEFRIEAKI